MATWYYTRDGATFGPYSEETMTELIGNGSVTFVTPVWDADTKNDGMDWLYAYDTTLAEHFSNDIPQEQTDIPPEGPPVPEPLPELPREEIPSEPIKEEPKPQPGHPETAALPSRAEAAKAMKKPGKTPRSAVIFLLLFLTGLIIGTALYYLYSRFHPGRPAGMPTETAVPGSDTVAIKMTDMGVPRSIVSGMTGYVMIETDAAGELERMYKTYSPFTAMSNHPADRTG